MDTSIESAEKELLELYDSNAEGCVECGLCQKDCLFLQKYGSPKQIAEKRSLNTEDLRTSFECSLCWLCTAVCPKDIDPAAMFGAMRNLAQVKGQASFDKHGTILRYESWGASSLISWYGLPDGCETVFFPGCALAGSRSERVLDLYNHLKKTIPSLGIVLDCCTKPSHDLGRKEFFFKMFGSLRDSLAAQGVKEILVACPSCYRVWKDYGNPVKVKTIYEQLADMKPARTVTSPMEVTVHDPCSTRYDSAVHKAVRKMVKAMGLSLREMKHHSNKTVCCGEGGAACYIVPEYAVNWTDIRAKEAEGSYMVTYCAGCTHFLGRSTRVGHIVDLFFEPEKTLAGKESISRSPWTWLKRLLLKHRLKSVVGAKVTGKRDKEYRPVFKKG